MEKQGKLFMQLVATGTEKPIKLFSKVYPYQELVLKVQTAYTQMRNGDLYYFEFQDKKGCVHFVGDEAFRLAHIWVQTEESYD